jgi:2'-5' RNA ligase
MRSPQLLFVSAKARREDWARLIDSLRPELLDLGFELETKLFQPHLTLLRVKDPHAVVDLLPQLTRALGNFEAVWNVESFCLVSSRLGPQGAQYETLETYQLKKAE